MPATKRMPAVIKLLLAAGADPNLKSKWLHWTPLHIVCHGGNLKGVKALLERNTDPNAMDNHCRTPLHDAVCTTGVISTC